MLQPLYCNHDHYWMAINALYQDTQRQEIFAKWTEEEFDSHVVNVLSERFGNGKPDDQPLHVLGVGSSEGYQEVLQLKKLQTKFPQISATVVEPHQGRISKYQETVDKERIDGVEYEWHNKTFQEFMKSREGAEKKYHFISIVHAIYYTGEVEETVRNLYRFLQPGGIIFMVVVSDRSGMALLCEAFPQLALEEHNPTTSGPLAPKTNYLTNSGVVKSVLHKYQMVYTQASYTESADITTCFTRKEMSPTAKLLLDFITMTVKFAEMASDEIFDQVMEFLKSIARIESTTQGDDIYYFDSVSDILVISK